MSLDRDFSSRFSQEPRGLLVQDPIAAKRQLALFTDEPIAMITENVIRRFLSAGA